MGEARTCYLQDRAGGPSVSDVVTEDEDGKPGIQTTLIYIRRELGSGTRLDGNDDLGCRDIFTRITSSLTGL
jgi:hypothetical protein